MSDSADLSPYTWYWISAVIFPGYGSLFAAFFVYQKKRILTKRGQRCKGIITKTYKINDKHYIDYIFTHNDEQYGQELLKVSLTMWRSFTVNSEIDIIYDPLHPHLFYLPYSQMTEMTKGYCYIILGSAYILGFGICFGTMVFHFEWYHILITTFAIPIAAWLLLSPLCFCCYKTCKCNRKKRDIKVEDRDANLQTQQTTISKQYLNVSHDSIYGIFIRLFVLSLCISAAASVPISLQYFVFYLNFSGGTTNSGIYTQILNMLPLICWTQLYSWFLTGYNSYIFNFELVRLYKIPKSILCSSTMAFLCSFFSWIAIITIWLVHYISDVFDYYYDHTDDTNIDEELSDITDEYFKQLTSITNATSWSVAILMTPVWILFVGYIVAGLCICTSMRKRIKREDNELLINDDFNLNDNWSINKCVFCRVILIHTLLLSTWIGWKWITTPDIDTDASGGARATRNNPFLSYWSLYICTSIMKYICIFLVYKNEENQILFESKRLKRMISILTSILFAFGLKIVFSNIKEWTHFLIVSVINVVLKIFVNGSLQSHEYGKQCISASKQCICCCKFKKVNIGINEMINYNKDLALDLSLNFLISTSSSLIMMCFFALMMALYSVKINSLVFEFMAASFGIDCIIFFGQIVAFKKRDRKYFIELLFEKIAKNISSKDKPLAVFSTFDILAICLLLAWFWVAGLTVGPPSDFDS